MPANIQLALVVNLKFREFLLLLELYKEGSFSFKTIVRTNQHYRSKLITLDFFYFGGVYLLYISNSIDGIRDTHLVVILI